MQKKRRAQFVERLEQTDHRELAHTMGRGSGRGSGGGQAKLAKRNAAAQTPLSSAAHDSDSAGREDVQDLRAQNSNNTIDDIRSHLLQLDAAAAQARRQIQVLQDKQAQSQTTRKGFLMTIEDRIGPEPSHCWREEMEKNKSKLYEWSSEVTQDEYSTGEMSLDDHMSHWLQLTSDKKSKVLSLLMELGWAEDDAIIYNTLSVPRARCAMAHGLSTGDAAFSSCTYALCNAMFRTARKQSQRGSAPLLFRHLRGPHSLAESDPNWEHIEEPDATGFRGLTSPSTVRGRCDDDVICAAGYNQYFHRCDQSPRWEPQASDIVCFVSGTESEHGMHTAILTEYDTEDDTKPFTHGAFPPNTLFRLVEVREAGTWHAPTTLGEKQVSELTNGVIVNQRLLVVRATYRQPTSNWASGMGPSKICGSVATLQYGTRSTYISGLSDVVDRPVLSMAYEFDRDMSWRDYKGVEYYLRKEWAYVNGPAVALGDCTPGTRDAGNDGKTPQQFCEEINAWITSQRKKSGVTKLPEGLAFLSLEEVLSVRLYSGPAYQPINTFLRQIALVSGSHRNALIHDLNHTFAATVGHLVSAVRKLAAVAEDMSCSLYRGVRGELPRGFWLKDSLNMVCATDTAFMSTSRNRETPISYMADDVNVLWELEARPESDSAYHCGADISLLSQFAQEKEVLFPPCCLLVVKEPPSQPPTAQEEGGKRFVVLKVQPSFV